jgi:hypothetical protein
MKSVVITQSNYVPWRGWFDMVSRADCLVLLDSVQYTRRDWRNRNRIKTAQGLTWLTIPTEVKGKFAQAIDETRISSSRWCQEHLRTLELAYRRAAHFESTFPWISETLRRASAETMLTKVNEVLLAAICERLNIGVQIMRDVHLLPRAALAEMEPTERLVALAEAVAATRYISGPAARAYLDPEKFAARGIELSWMEYPKYPEYPQLWGAFEPAVSILDLLLNTGHDARRWIWRELTA